jgi:signal peptidase I
MHDEKLIVNNLVNIWQEKEIVRPLPTEGKSMYPLIKQGDTIKIKFTKSENIKVGDIAAFTRGNSTIVHRLIRKDITGFIEKGDFHVKGTHIKYSNIIGKVETLNKTIDYCMALMGYAIYKVGPFGKPFLIIPFIINAGTRIYLKLHPKS